MNIQFEDFQTGWVGVSIGLKATEIDQLIEALRSLKIDSGRHFHFRSNYEGQGGVGDVEIYLEDEARAR